MIITEEQIAQYPELVAFFAAIDKQSQQQNIQQLSMYYRIDDIGFSPLFIAASIGHLASLNILLNRHQEVPLQVLLETAIENGHLPMVNRLLSYWSVWSSIGSNNNSELLLAAHFGHLDIFNRLLKFWVLSRNIHENNNQVLVEAARCGHLSIVNRLLQFSNVRRNIMAGDPAERAIVLAARNGHFEIVVRLLEFTEIRRSIAAEGNLVIVNAASNGHFEIVNYLLHISNVRKSLASQFNGNTQYSVLRFAAANGHLEIVNLLLSLKRVRNDTPIEYRIILRLTAANGHVLVMNSLLNFYKIFAAGEEFGEIYNDFVHPFMLEKIQLIKAAQQEFAATETGIFNLDLQNAQLCFYFIRNLIRQNHAELPEDFVFLLNIPAVRELAHVEVTVGKPNELIKLAIRIGNHPATRALLDIPEVLMLAEQNHFYSVELETVTLAFEALDNESSMRSLSTHEQKRLAAAFNYYQPVIDAFEVETLFENFYEFLLARYYDDRAMVEIKVNSTSFRTATKWINLPVTWEEFKALNLKGPELKRALVAYYQNTNHTALRYLTKPNLWMAENAPYVFTDEQNPNHRWARFEDYKPLIIMLWLAAGDEEFAPIGQTLADRMDFFIGELAQLGRAHNWEATRVRALNSGIHIKEQFDDLDGDKPSCFSGVKRRLFQSVHNHPLLKMLTLENVKDELRDFVRDHFKECISDENRTTLNSALKLYYAELIFDPIFNLLDIPKPKQEIFINKMSEKYGTQFLEDPAFLKYINTKFKLKTDISNNPLDDAHLLNFAGETAVDGLLDPKSNSPDLKFSLSFFWKNLTHKTPAEEINPTPN